MIANTLGEWLRRYWLMLLVALAAIVWLATRLLPRPGLRQTGVLTEARRTADLLKTEREAELKTVADEMDTRIRELTAIKAIADEQTRLQALADFANRKAARTR